MPSPPSFPAVRLQGGHLVAGHHADRVRADGAAVPRDVAHARPPQDPEERPARAGPAEQVGQAVQRLPPLLPRQGPKPEAQVRGTAQGQSVTERG